MENKCVSPTKDETPITVEVNCGEMQIPDHAIRRFARFLLPKIQADLGDKRTDESTLG